MASEFKIKNGLIVVGDVSTSGTITINGALAATQSWVSSQAYLTSSSLTSYATQSYVTSAIASLVDSAPGALDTLRELATALGNDASFSTTITNSIASKLPLAGGTMTGRILFQTSALNNGFRWDVNSDAAGITFKNTGDGDNNSYFNFFTEDNGNEYFKFSHNTWNIGSFDFMDVKNGVMRTNGNIFVNASQSGTSAAGTNELVAGNRVWHDGDFSATNVANWNTAYGWGNHASAGYLTSALAATTYVSLTGSYANPSWITSLAYSKITGVPAFLLSEVDTLATVTSRDATTNTSITVGPNLTVQADNSVGYTASRLWLNSHNNYRGAGVHMSGVGSTWFAGTPYTDFDGGYVIARTGTSNDQASAQYSNALLTVKSTGYVGIATTNPEAKLHIVYGSGQAGFLSRGPSGDTWFPYTNGQNYVRGITYFDNAAVYFTGGNIGIGTTSPIASLDNQGSAGTYRQRGVTTMVTDSLGASGTQARRYEIARATIDYNDWNSVGPIEIEVCEKYWSQGLRKKYTVYYGYVSTSGINLTEMTGAGQNNFQVTIGSEVVISGDLRYIPIYVDVRNYAIVTVILKTNRDLSTSNPPGIGGIWVNNAPTGTNISDFTADSLVYVGNLISGNSTFSTGNVGIGTISPSKKLHIKGGDDDVLFLDNGGQQYTTQYFANNGTTKAFLAWDNTNSVYSIGTAVSSAFYFSTNNTERMRITSGGNVGIGTTSPSAKFTVSGTQVETHINNGDTNTLTLGGFSGGRHFIKSINLGIALTPLTLQASSFTFDTGNVLIGTTTDAGYKLDVNGTGRFTSTLVVRNTSSTPSIWSGQYGGAISILGDNATSNRYIDLSIVDSTGALATQGLRVTNGGNVLIGTTTDAGYKLDVNGTGRFSGDVTIKNTSTHANLFIDAAATGGSEAGLYFKNGGTNKWENYTANNDTALNWYSYANTTVVFKLASTGAATFSSSVTVGTDVTLNNGILYVSAGSGTNYSSRLSTAYNYPYIDTYLDSYAGVSYEGRLQFRTNSGGGAMSTKLTIMNSGAATFSSVDSSGNRTTLNDVLTITQTNPNTPYSGFGSGILFKGTTYNSGGSGIPGVRNWGRIAMQLTDSSFNTNGEQMIFQVAPADNSDTLTTALTIASTGAATFSSSVTAQDMYTISNSSEQIVIKTASDTNKQLIFGRTATEAKIIAVTQGIGYVPIALNPNGGNVLIGTTTDAGYKLDVNGTGRFSGALTGTSATFSSSVTAVSGFIKTGYSDSYFLLAGGGTTLTSNYAPSTGGNYVPLRSQSNWNDATSVISNVVGMLGWKNYSNSHVIFDASASTSPSGTGVSSTNAANAWVATYPTLMGWNGNQTYGVRVDSARLADTATTATSAPWGGITGKPSGSTGLVQYGDYVNYSTFAGKTLTLHPSTIKGLLWGGNGTRYTVADTYTGTYPQAGSTWIRTYELIDGSNSVYSSGNIYCGFWDNNPPANITVRVQNTSGTWYGPYQGTNIGVGYFEYWKIPCGGPNYIKAWEITFTPKPGLGINLITTDIVIDNSEGIDQSPYVSRGGNSMYGNLSFVGTGNVTNTTINTSGVVNLLYLRPSNNTGKIEYQNIGGTLAGSMFMDGNIWRFKSQNNSDTLNIFSNGNLGIKQTSDAGYTFDINGTTRLNGVLTLSSTISNGTYTYTLPSATGILALTSDLSSYVSTSRTITINGTTFDLTANRTFTINSMVYPGAGIAVSTGTAWGTSITNNSTNWNTAYGWGNHASYSYATTSYVTTQINNLIAGAPGALDTLSELATALGNDASFATTVTNSIAAKLPLAGGNMTGSIGMGAGANIAFTGGSHSIYGNNTGYLHFYDYTDVYFNNQLVIRGGIRNDNGNVLIDDNLTVTGTITESSSIKLKENVETSKGNLEKVVNLRPVTYNKIGSQTTELGLIAEEVATVYPEFVQYDESGEPVGVNYSRLTAALIGAVKELTKRIETLENNG